MNNNAAAGDNSQPMANCSHYQKLVWLQKKRTVGLWVQCDDCNRWRYLPDILDKHQLSKKWYCSMNPDRSKANCSVPEDPINFSEAEDLIHSEYAAGSLVVARLRGWPWWPAMVDDCPDTEQYYWLDGFSDIPTHYNVVFFDAHNVTRAWVAPGQLKPYAEGQHLLKKSLRNRTYQKRLHVAIDQADDAETLPLTERLAKYSFITKFKGNILSPKKIDRTEAQKYQEDFKRKYKVDLPFESSDSDEEVALSEQVKKLNESNKKGKPKKSKIREQKKNETIVETNIDKTCSLIKTLSMTADINNNLETLKDSFTNDTVDDKLQDHPMPTPPSDDFDF